MTVRLYSATVSYRDRDGLRQEEAFPVRAHDHTRATELAVAYVVRVLKLREFELRVVGG